MVTHLKRALVREPGDNYRRCISAHPLKHTIDVGLARTQHKAYVSVLEGAGLKVIELERDDAHADSCFVEDTAVVHGDKALICRPAMESRRYEVEAIGEALSEHLEVRRASPPATVEGGDVLHLEDGLVSGVTGRTNEDGVRQMAEWLGVRVDTIEDPSIMHLKSYVSYIGPGRVLVHGRYAGHAALAGLDKLLVPEDEGYAANVLFANGVVIIPRGFPKTERLLETSGTDVVALDMSEFPKCEGAMTCLSVLF